MLSVHEIIETGYRQADTECMLKQFIKYSTVKSNSEMNHIIDFGFKQKQETMISI